MNQITRFDRTSSFSIEDYELLRLLLSRFQRLLVTAHILTEVSNLMGQLRDPLRTQYFERLQAEICVLQEEPIESSTAAGGQAFVRFGLTDAGIHTLAEDGRLVITGDFPLYMFLSSQNIAVINFNQLRPFGWELLRRGHFREG